MVTQTHVPQLISEHFIIDGAWHVNPHTHLVDVSGDVMLISMPHEGALPVKFGVVTGMFECGMNPQLTSLEGAPQKVMGGFNCRGTGIMSLKGAPSIVGGSFSCVDTAIKNLVGAPTHVHRNFYMGNNPLVSLDGAPVHVDHMFIMEYMTHLPLLRLLNYVDVVIHRAPEPVSQIISKYVGQGKAAMLNCALELKAAGYGDNAKW